MAPLRAPKVSEKLVPVFTSEELSALEKTCQGRSFAQRRDVAIIAVLTATGIRAGELAGIRYDAGDPRRSDVDLWRREHTVPRQISRPDMVALTWAGLIERQTIKVPFVAQACLRPRSRENFLPVDPARSWRGPRRGLAPMLVPTSVLVQRVTARA